jgi:LPXTG-motif cell wall-anchored protein
LPKTAGNTPLFLTLGLIALASGLALRYRAA